MNNNMMNGNNLYYKIYNNFIQKYIKIIIIQEQFIGNYKNLIIYKLKEIKNGLIKNNNY